MTGEVMVEEGENLVGNVEKRGRKRRLKSKRKGRVNDGERDGRGREGVQVEVRVR